MSQMAFKVVLLGEGRVGKTSLCLRYVQNSFSDKQKSTITATYLDKFLNIGQKSVKLMIWDTAVQTKFQCVCMDERHFRFYIIVYVGHFSSCV
mmetsp:Transcript_15818/g.30920  ORF Transcript_15818/g.30920 Transcript_15818/m.30920 type:complete len:93 (+) Transcript_15818:84-362(+)